MYPYLYRLIQKIILKRSFNTDLIKLINEINPKQIIDIGCADSTLLNNINNNSRYCGFDLNETFINKSKSKYKLNKNFMFFKKSVDEIDFNEFNSENSLIILIGLFHHINDAQVRSFNLKTKRFKVLAIDAVKMDDQKYITKLLLALDRGDHIRKLNDYKELLPEYNFFTARNKYLRFSYDHLVSAKNIENHIIKDIFS
jgi:hypothetical protein